MNIGAFYLRKASKNRRSGASQGIKRKKVIKISMEMSILDKRRYLKDLKEKKNEARESLAHL